ncbi:MAG TPA: hypothetical protein VM051_05275 [Usitatibacter sp.]|nr:hypothetical protein [Usitatibacter sp.]
MAAVVVAVVGAACSGGGGNTPSQMSAVAPASSGKLDPVYENGIKLVYVGEFDPLDMAVDANGKVSIGGRFLAQFDVLGRRIVTVGILGSSAEISPVGDEAGNLFTLGRLDSGGYELIKRDVESRLVAGFGTGGRMPIDMTGFTALTGLSRDRDGNFYLLGEIRPPNIKGPVTTLMGKLDANGQRVMGYGNGGVAQLPGIYRVPEPAVTVDAGGNAYFAAVGDGAGTVLKKLDAQGRLIPDFGLAGDAVVPCLRPEPLVASDTSGNVFVAGPCFDPALANSPSAVWKFDARGNPVMSFGIGGRAAGFFSPRSESGTELPGAAFALLPNADGSVYVAASSLRDGTCAGGFAIVKLGADGRADNSFGVNGVAAVPLRAGRWAALGTDRSGRVYVLGETPPASGCPAPRTIPSSFSLFRLA